MIMESFKSYRFRHGLVGKDVSKAALDAAKNTYRKAYQKEYRKRRKANVIRKEITMTKKEAELLYQFSIDHHLSENQCLKICAFSVIENKHPVLQPKALSELIYQLRKVGVNINQMAYKVNQNRFHDFNETYLQQQLAFMEHLIRSHLTCGHSEDGIRDNFKMV